MAINLNQQYPGRTAGTNQNYPYGQGRNVTTQGDGTGTPFEAAWFNDVQGFFQAILSAANVVPSGTPDNAQISQYLEAISRISTPPGCVTGFAGTEIQIPQSWQLCNGAGTTSNGIQIPDLRNRFLVGAGSQYNRDSTGGSTNKTTTSQGSHAHAITVNNRTLSVAQMPSHSHGITRDFGQGREGFQSRFVTDSFQSTSVLNINSEGGSGAHNHGASSNSTGNHTL